MMPITDLGELLHFTPEDLDLNRQGKLGQSQGAYLQQIARTQRGYYVSMLIYATIISAIITILFWVSGDWLPGQKVLAVVMSVIMVLIVVVGGGAIAYFFNRAMRSIAEGNIQLAQGRVESFKVRAGSADATVSIVLISNPYRFFVQIGQQPFMVTEDVYKALHNRHSYAAYYIPLMRRTIISAEEITTEKDSHSKRSG